MVAHVPIDVPGLQRQPRVASALQLIQRVTRTSAHQSSVTTGCTLQEIRCLSDMLQRLLNGAAASLGEAAMCCYSTEAVIQYLGRRTKLFAFIAR